MTRAAGDPAPVASANLAALLPYRAESHPDRTAIVEWSAWGRRRTTFAELAREVRATAARLAADGVGPGTRVLLFVPMSTDLYRWLLAVLHVGGTAVFVDAWADRRRLDAGVRAARPQVFVGTPRAHLLRLTSPAVRRIPMHRMAGLPARSGVARGSAAPAAPVPVDPDTPALVTFTTGSTGTPKAAARSHRFLLAQHHALASHLGLRETDVDMPTLPVFVLNNLALGVPSVLPRFDARRPAAIRPWQILRQMRAEGVTTASGSPAFFERLARWVARRGSRIPVRALFTGGAPVYPPLAALLAETTEGEAHVVYGSTEAEPIAGITAAEMLLAAEEPTADGVCVGRPVPEIELRVIRAHDGDVVLGGDGWATWEVPPGETGEVVVSGEHVLGRYLNDPDADRRQKIRDGERVWHRTGDAARVDTRGRIWLMGRVADRVRKEGRTWWSGPAEVRALRLTGVRHAAFLGVEIGGAVRAVLCIETAGKPPPTEQVRAALHPIPVDDVRVLRRIPRDPRHASKTDTAALRRLLAAGGAE